jgi:tRNA-uridine 2-sulfurtransferase
MPLDDFVRETNPIIPGKAPAHTRVVVAMSGGVDSSVVAGLLVEQGYEVIGITLQLYDHGLALAKKGACCAGQDIYDARQVAERLNIPHYVLDYESRFKESVIAAFAQSYLEGQTPIPCVRCNQTVKFADLLATAQDLGADALATGHYVRRVIGPQGQTQLWRARDLSRDQSYFLFATTRPQLGYLRFPLGDLPSKAITRTLAARYGLATADKPDSQDICFVPNGDYASVVSQLRPEAKRPGGIFHLDGRYLGEHQGIIGFTVGQRRGLGIGGGEPLYVVRLDPERAAVIVGPKSALARKRVFVEELNWLGPIVDKDGLMVTVKLRSMQTPVEGKIFLQENNKSYIELALPHYGVAPGQACVVYQGQECLGGGIITGSA